MKDSIKKFYEYEISSVINMISNFRVCTEKELLEAGYTNEKYMDMIAERIEELEGLRREFVNSLSS